MIDAKRERLGQAQAALVRALVAQGPIPAGFDEGRVRAAARSLVSKRRQALARSWPNLVRSLSGRYEELFTKYAQAHPLPTCASPSGDGRAFLAWLDTIEPLGDASRIEALAFDLRWLSTPYGLRPRAGLGFKLARLRESRALIVGVRLPWLGIRWWGLPGG